MKVDKKIPLRTILSKRIISYIIALTFVMGIFFISSIPSAHATQVTQNYFGIATFTSPYFYIYGQLQLTSASSGKLHDTVAGITSLCGSVANSTELTLYQPSGVTTGTCISTQAGAMLVLYIYVHSIYNNSSTSNRYVSYFIQ